MAARLVIAALALLALALPASAEPLQRLHVRSFTLTADTAHPRVNVPFDLTLTIRVAERVQQLDNVYLPSFTGAEELGDERTLTSGPHGTIYRETMRLVAHAGGPLAIGSAYLDAVDARDGKPKRFISGGLTLQVQGPLPDARDALRSALRALAALAIGALIVTLAALLIVRRRRAPAPPAPAPPSEPAQPPAPAAPPEDALTAALAQLRARRDRANVMRVREVLWRKAGAREGETLSEALARVPAGAAGLRAMLTAAEYAAFVDDERLPRAIEALLTTTEERTL